LNISRILYWAEKKYRDRTAVIYNDEQITFRDILKTTERHSHYFSLLGLDSRKPVVVSLPNVPEFIYVTMSLNSLGIPILLTNIAVSSLEMAYMLEDSGADTVISYSLSPEYTGRVMSSLKRKVNFIDIKEPSVLNPKLSFEGHIKSLEPRRVFVPVLDPRPTVIIYTSGEDGYLRGACLSFKNLMSNILATHEYMSLTQDDRVFSLLPFYHAYGFSNTLLAGFLTGAGQLLVDRYRTTQILQFIEQYKITRIQSVPMMFYSLLNHRSIERFDLSSLKTCISGGSPLDGDFQKSVRGKYGIDIRQGFGITEASAAVTFNFFDEEMVFGSCGKPFPIFSTRIVDDDGRILPLGETGEMQIKGPSVTERYTGRYADCRDRLTEDGWFRTGDYFMIDKGGNHFFKGLKKEMFLVGSYNVYPREVERIISGIQGVIRASLYSREHDAKGNYIIGADITIDSMDNKDRIFRDMHTSLSPYKIPSRIEWKEEK